MREMFHDQIAVTLDREEEAGWRMPRLHRIIGYVCALADQANNPDLLDKVAELHDHKGVLTVKWLVHPTEQEAGFFQSAWESIIGDGCDNVEHEMH